MRRGEQAPQIPTPGVSSRRSACDRCRGQKLRCLREAADQDGRCDRCSKADIQCITSPIYRMRNYSTEDDINPAAAIMPRKRRRPDDQEQGQQASSNIAPFTASKWPTTEPYTIPQPTTDALGNGSLDMASWNSLLYSEPIPSSLSAAITDAPNAWDAGHLNLDSLFLGNAETLFTFDNATAKDDVSHSFGPELGSQPPAVQEHDPLETSQHTTGPRQGLEVHGDGLEGEGEGEGQGLLTQIMGNQTSNSTHMEQLAKINLDLVTQLSRMIKGPPHVNLKLLITPCCDKSGPSSITPLEEILNTTRQFLDTLSFIANSSPSSASSSTPGITGGHDRDSSSSSSDDSSSASTPEDSQVRDSLPVSKHSTGTTCQMDSATLFLIVGCYVHILRLHVALFSHVYKFLHDISITEEQFIHALPGLYGFSNFPLQSGNLQATMVIQLVITMFERIESLLGLPREFRLGTRDYDHNQGLLREQGFVELAVLAIRKEDTGKTEEGKGGIKSLRKDMKKSRRLLRSGIKP